VLFLADFRSKTNFWLNFPLLETLPSPFESSFITRWALQEAPSWLQARLVWACLSAVIVPVYRVHWNEPKVSHVCFESDKYSGTKNYISKKNPISVTKNDISDDIVFMSPCYRPDIKAQVCDKYNLYTWHLFNSTLS
jgi:hypothetical protein